jgi:carbonic anhydrase
MEIKQAVTKDDKKTPVQVVEKKREVPVDTIGVKLLQRLGAGNARFVQGKLSRKEFGKQRPDLAKGQHPYAVVITCSDSRVPPEHIFDESLGQLFVIRVAGNVLDSVGLGSVEYAVEHLHATLVVVMGHSECGAVKAAVAGGEVKSNVLAIVQRLTNAVAVGRQKAKDEKDIISSCVEENVNEQLKVLETKSAIIKESIEEKHIRVVGAVYDLATGKVNFLSERGSVEKGH